MKPPSKVIVSDDEWLTRLTFAGYLTNAGYELVEAATAEDTLALLEESAETISVLITDFRLDGSSMDGVTLAHHATRYWPWIKLLVVSGEAPSRLAGAPVSCGVLRKPIDTQQTVVEVRALTDKSQCEHST